MLYIITLSEIMLPKEHSHRNISNAFSTQNTGPIYRYITKRETPKFYKKLKSLPVKAQPQAKEAAGFLSTKFFVTKNLQGEYRNHDTLIS